MADTSFSKPEHTNGPIIKLYDLGTGGPYSEAAAMVGWDAVNLQWLKVAVDTSGQLKTTGGGGTGGTADVQYAEGVAVATGTGNLILGKDGTNVVHTPTVKALTSATPMAVMVVDGAGAQITSFGTATTTVVQGTATNLNATVVGTVTSVPSGTQNVAGSVTVLQPTGTNLHAVIDSGTITTVPSGTQSVAQTGSPWGVSGTITNVPSGTQSVAQAGAWTTTVTQSTASNLNATVVGTVTTVPSGVQTVSGTVNIGTATIVGTNTTLVVDTGGNYLSLSNDQTLAKTIPVTDSPLINRLDTLIQLFQDANQPKDSFVRPYGRVGPSLLSDGQFNEPRLDYSGAGIVQDAHGRFQEAVIRGSVFTANTADLGAVGPTNGGTALVGLIVYNPINSRKNLVLLNVSIAFAGALGTNITYNWFLEGSPIIAATPTGVTALTPRNNFLGNGQNSVALAYTTATVVNAPTRYLNITAAQTIDFNATSTAAPAVTAPVLFSVFPLEGILIVSPGTYIKFSGNQTSPVMNASFTWEEVPI